MVLRYLLERFLNNPQVIDKLADSYPIRRAAQLTAYALQRGKVAAQDAVESEVTKRMNQFRSDFYQELKEGFRKIEEDYQKKQK